MNRTKRKVSCTFKREIPLEFQERIYPLPGAPVGWATRHCAIGFRSRIMRVSTFENRLLELAYRRLRNAEMRYCHAP